MLLNRQFGNLQRPLLVAESVVSLQRWDNLCADDG
jgi:hypothetical protein